MMKQKKITKVVNPPSNNEVKSSNVFQELQLSYDNFKQSNTNDEFNSFNKSFTTFLNEETNTKLLLYFSPIMIQNIIDDITSIEFNPIYANQTFSLINLITTKMGVIFSASSFTTLFLFLSNGENDRFKILKDNEEIISNIFSDENFFNEFINTNHFYLSYQTLFLNNNNSTNEICSFFNHLIFTISPIELLTNYNCQTIIDGLQTKMPKESLYPETAIFLTHLFSLNSKFQFYFNENEHFEFLTKLLNSSSFDTILQCFQALIFTEPKPNFNLFKNIVGFYQNNLKIQDQFFIWIFEFVKSYPNIVSEVNSIVPFSNWITPKTPVSKLLNAMKLMNSIHPSLVSQFLSLYFSLLCKEEADIDSYICGIGIVESQIFHRRISLNFLLNSLFLNAFIVKPSIDLLNEIFIKSYTFAQLVYDIYALPDAKPIRQEVLGKIIQASLKNNDLTSIVSAFLVISGSNENLREMMNLIEKEKSGDLCDSFCSAFPKSKVLTSNFLQEYGMKWIFSVFDKKIIDLEKVKSLIMGLTSRVNIQNVDDFIESLPKNHPLFQLEADEIRSLIYGIEDPPVYYPIRVYSLFHLIPCPWSIDPYNAYIIGKNVLHKYDDIMNLPIIGEIGNRYINSDIFYEFLKKPSQLEQFTDTNYDHFPIFQVFEYTDEKIFDMNYKSISFWFKFASSIDESLKIPFFHASKFNLFLKKSILIANYEGTEYEVPIDPLNWNHIFVSISSSLISHKIKIWVNLSKAVFTSPTKLSELSNFGFLVYASYLYIGPSIRVYQSELHEYKKIFELGPSSLEKLNEDFLLTPFSSEISCERNILPVHYNGFPAHFKSRAKLNYFFEIMKKTENENDFDKLLSLFYKIYIIIRHYNQDLFSLLLTFFASIPDRLTKDRFINILTFFGKHKNNKILIDDILKNQSFWKKISNDIIIFCLVSYFKTFDFYNDIDTFQFFMSQKMISNQNSKYIMTSFLVNSKALPKCQKCLLALFLCHHFMKTRTNRETQCTIKGEFNSPREIKDEQKDETNQYYQLINRKNVSVQCQIDYSNDSFYFDEQLLLFNNEVCNTELQFTLIDCFYNFIEKTGTAENIKLILPMEDLLSLFIVSQNNFKSSLFKIFVLIEKMSPGFMIINNLFLTSFFPLFIYQSVWDETMSLVCEDDHFVNNSSISLLLALIWSFTAAQLHSVAQTGKKLSIQFDKEIKFCLSNSNFIVSNKTAQHFIRIWYPLLFGYLIDKNDSSLSSIRLESVEITPPKVPDFSNHIWRSVIQAAREIDEDLPMKNDNFYQKEFKDFISKSELFSIFYNILLETHENQFIHIFSPFLLIPLISEKKISESFISEFTTNCLTYLSQTFTLDMPFNSFIPILHYMSNNGLLKSNFQFILSDIFLIMSLLRDLHNKFFKKISNSLNNLLIDLFNNCDSDSFNLLFNILQQNVLIFIDIVKLTNSLDFYLCFFQKVAHNCYNEFDLFFKKFINSAQINPNKNKKVEELLNHVEINDNSQNNKINKVLNSLNSISKTIKNEINECYQSMMTELTENSKEFSLTYFISSKRQHNFVDSLNKLFESIDKIQNPEEYFNNSIKSIQESIIDSITININDSSISSENKRLFPFSFPSELPRLFIPVPLLSPKDSLKFISEHKLYTTKLSSFEPLEKISLSSNSTDKMLNRQKGKKRSLSPSSSSLSSYKSNSNSNSSSEADLSKKRSNSLRSFSSQPLPRSDEVANKKRIKLTHTQSSDHLIPLNSVFSHSMANSTFIPYSSSLSFQFTPIIFNCQLMRFNYSIPTVVSISSNNMRLIPFAKYEQNIYLNSNSSLLTISDSNLESDSDLNSSSPRGNFSLDKEFVAKFVMEVINGFWGETQLFEKRIVIKIPLNTILYISQKSDNCFTIWSQKSGTFVLNGVDNDILSKIPFNVMNPLSSVERFEDKNEVIEKWIDGKLSNSQMIVALNISEGRNYIDLRNFVKVPDQLTIFGTFSPINESLAANLTEGLMIGNLGYSNSIELKENDENVFNFIKKFDVSNNSFEKHNSQGKVKFTFNDKILCQKISGTIPQWTLFDNNSIITDLPILSARISPDFPLYIIIDKGDMTTYIYNYSEREKIFTFYSEDFSIAKSISVSQNYMFVSVDFESNFSYVYRIIYESCLPTKIEFIRENSFLNDQTTTVNGSELIAATFSGKSVYIWPFYRFSYHRIINFEEEIRFCQFDDNAGTFWAFGKFSCFLIDCNGQLFSSCKLENEISSFSVVPRSIGECDRSVICGFDDGSVALISPKLETAELFVKKLNKVHQSRVIKIVFHPKKTYFMTIDNCQNAFFWSQKNVAEIGEELDVSVFSGCPSCGKKPFGLCSSCKRAFCNACLNESNICPDCLSSD